MGFNSFEDRLNANIDRNREAKKREDSAHIFETSPIIRAAYQKAHKVFAEDSIKPEEFEDIYGEDIIKRDKERVKELKTKFFEAGSAKIAADILEAIILEQTELADWFGPNATTVKTNEFDDYVNGVDGVFEFNVNNPERPASHMALAFDATFATKDGPIEKKMNRIRDEINRGQLATIKYFRSSDRRFHGKLSGVPRVIVGLEKDTIVELARLWVMGEKKALAEHPAQRMILEQVKRQLQTFTEYAFNANRKDLERAFAEPLAIVREIYAQKKDIPLGKLAHDRVNAEILARLDGFERRRR